MNGATKRPFIEVSDEMADAMIARIEGRLTATEFADAYLTAQAKQVEKQIKEQERGGREFSK